MEAALCSDPVAIGEEHIRLLAGLGSANSSNGGGSSRGSRLLPVPSPIAASPLAQGSGFAVFLAAVDPVRSPSSVKPYEVAIDAVVEREGQ